ncbi:SDR family oxidoreductase [Oceanobacillus indicireducens]|uniref:Short-chain dehydrogenase n=1 Tax=Oceanobacillus indicireducens TaxID=1004261 RepID=A0A917XTQ6_9BACI|nr:SDR family oxidoreductase [Oceanobacillus indicireducens]GGN51855.1 short-chain dehydrogenase [Oceanobacillus indicireducens]
MDLKLKGQSVIVAASSKGLGKAIALKFAEEGAHFLISSRREEELKLTAAEIRKKTGNEKVRYKTCDITDESQIKKLVGTAIEWNGKVDVLINNAGGPPAGTFDKFSDSDWQAAFELNLTREVLPSMRESGAGRIVNIASSSIKQILDNLILSNTFRAGIVGLSKSLSQELAGDNILVNTIGPGRIATDRVQELDEIRADHKEISYEQLRNEVERSIPIGRYGEPEEFANMVVFLASGANSYVTGQSLVVDGGLVKAL